MNVSAEEKPSGQEQQQQPVVEGSGMDPVTNTVKDAENKDEKPMDTVNAEQNAPYAQTKDSKEEGNGNDKQATDRKSTGVENPKEEPSEEDLKSMPVRQYLENTGTGLSILCARLSVSTEAQFKNPSQVTRV